MVYVILPNLQIVHFFVCPIIESFKKILICRLAMSSIVVYCTIIIPNILNKMADCIELRIVKSWLT